MELTINLVKGPPSKNKDSSSEEKNLFDIMYENKGSLSAYNHCRTDNSSLNSKDNSKGDKNSFSLNNDLVSMEGILFCDKCKGPLYINFLDNLDLSFDCNCSLLKNSTIEEYIKEYMLKQKNKNYIFCCQKHPNETKFDYYCPDCDYDLCPECLNEESKTYSNTRKKYKTHENHSLIKLDEIIQKFKNIKDNIENYKKNIKESNIYNKDQKHKIIDIFQLINIILNFYPQYKCYNFYRTIENAEKFLEKIKNNFIFGKHEDFIFLRKITSEKNLEQIKDFSDIISINIKYSQFPIDLAIFKDKKFPYLKTLKLVGTKIDNILPLFSCEFPVLEILHLERNEIDNTIIDLLKQVNLPNLLYLSLFVNKITNIQIFEVIEKFNKLKAFHIGENKFDFVNNNKSFYKFPETLEEFGLTGNFNGENVEFIEKLGIDNLKTFYFSRNKITNLKYLKNIKFKRLERFWSISNELNDIKEIMNINNKESLKFINLRENKIKNLKELLDMISHFPKLEKLILSDNEDIKEKEVEEMMKNIKEKYNRDLSIII